jgi:hypothetical protein
LTKDFRFVKTSCKIRMKVFWKISPEMRHEFTDMVLKQNGSHLYGRVLSRALCHDLCIESEDCIVFFF